MPRIIDNLMHFNGKNDEVSRTQAADSRRQVPFKFFLLNANQLSSRLIDLIQFRVHMHVKTDLCHTQLEMLSFSLLLLIEDTVRVLCLLVNIPIQMSIDRVFLLSSGQHVSTV